MVTLVVGAQDGYDCVTPGTFFGISGSMWVANGAPSSASSPEPLLEEDLNNCTKVKAERECRRWNKLWNIYVDLFAFSICL